MGRYTNLCSLPLPFTSGSSFVCISTFTVNEDAIISAAAAVSEPCVGDLRHFSGEYEA